MSDDEEAEAAEEPRFLPPARRRSTYKPPTGPLPAIFGGPDAADYDDDELADALADQTARLERSGPVAVEPASPPAVLPAVPRRRSLSDSALTELIGERASTAGTLDAITELETQLQLRRQEAVEFGDWERRMRDIGTPEALGSIESARPVFFGASAESETATPSSEGPAGSADSAEPAAPAGQGGPPPVAERLFVAPIIPEPDRPSDAEDRQQTEDQQVEDQQGVERQVEDQQTVERQVEDQQAEAEPWPLIEPGPVTPPAVELTGIDALLAEPDLSSSGPVPSPLAPRVEEPAEPDAVQANPLEALGTPAEPASIAVTEGSGTSSVDDPIFIEPVGFVDAELGPVQTGSVRLVPPTPHPEPDDQVDDTDRAFDELVGPLPLTAEGEVLLPAVTGSAPVQPVASPRIPEDRAVLGDEEPQRQPIFSLELAGTEPTALEQRVGRSARLFWLWFATNSSVVSIAFGGVLFSLGVSLRQAIVATFVGVAISFLPLGLGTLAGKWSGQPTMVVSRASFGLIGNVVPAALAVITRLFWGGVLLWILGAAVASIIVGAKLNGPFDELSLTLIAVAIGFVLAVAIAIFGYHLLSRIQLGLSILSAVLVIGIIAVTWHSVDIGAALTVGDGPWILVVTGVVLVFSFFGLVWANSSGDLARYQRRGSSSAASMLLGPFGTTLPAFVLVAYGALLAASSPSTAEGLVAKPIDTIALMIPVWYPVPLIAATALSLLSGLVLSIYSGGFAIQSLGLRVPRPVAVAVIGVLSLAVAVVMILSTESLLPVFRDLVTTLAVPVAAWAGIFAAEMILRRRGFHAESLLRRGGIYPDVRWVNLGMLIVATAIGLGLCSATVGWLGWEGYLFRVVSVPLDGDLAGSDLGVLVALLLGLLTPLVAGVRAVREQEDGLA